MIFLIVIAVITALVLITYVASRLKLNSLMNYLHYSYGIKADPAITDEYRDSITQFYNLSKDDNTVDDITWNDLDMLSVYDRVNGCLSSVGDENLYAHLRNQHDFDNHELTEISLKIKEAPLFRKTVQKALGTLGRSNGNGLINQIHSKKTSIPPQFSFLPVQAIAALIPLVLLLFGLLELAFTIFVGVFIFNMITYLILNKPILRHLRALNYFVDLLKCARMIERDTDLKIEGLNRFTSIRSYLNIVSIAPNEGSGISSFISIFSAYFCLYGFSFMKLVNAIDNNIEEAEAVYRAVGLVDIAYARASLLEYAPISTPHFEKINAPKVVDMTHPLIDNAVPNSVNLEKSMLVTGSNASGKSTFVRSLAINIILGQRLNLCYAESMTFQKCFVATSMAISDDVLSGDSYFVAEIKSIKRLLKAVEDHDFSLLIIDEILKGTNTIERIAASSSILNKLSAMECFVCAASHDIELVSILQAHYTNIHFRETITDDGIEFDYKLHEGPSNTRNAIQLLKYYDYDENLINQANTLADSFTESQQWQILS